MPCPPASPHQKRIFMRIREYHENDLQSLRAIHAAQGFDYELPDLRGPLFVTKLVLTDDEAPTLGNATDSLSHAVSRTNLPIGAAPKERNAKILGAVFLRL